MIAVAARQHGRITGEQLAALGISRSVAAKWVAAGWVVREHRGCFRLAGAPTAGIGRCVGAVLAVDPCEGAVTYRTALERHGVLPELTGAPVHVTAPRHRRPRPGITVHESVLPPSCVERIGGLRVASLNRALIEVARNEPHDVVAAAVREAEFQRLLDPHALLADAHGLPGTALLRVLARAVLPIRGELREELERRFGEFLRARGFPVADVNRAFGLHNPVQKVVIDVVWPGAAIAVELDGRRAHDTTRAFEADRLRDRRVLTQLGLHVVRVTWRQLHDDPEALEADLKTLLARGVAARGAV